MDQNWQVCVDITGNQSEKFRGNLHSLSENTAKSVRGYHFDSHWLLCVDIEMGAYIDA